MGEVRSLVQHPHEWSKAFIMGIGPLQKDEDGVSLLCRLSLAHLLPSLSPPCLLP